VNVFEVISPHTEQSIAEVARRAGRRGGRRQCRAHGFLTPGRGVSPSRPNALRRFAGSQMSMTNGARRWPTPSPPRSALRSPSPNAPRSASRDDDARVCDLAERHPWQETRSGFFGADVLVHKQPVGVVAAIVPWNMPQFLHRHPKLVPALLAGCTVVVEACARIPFGCIAFSGDDRPHRPAVGRCQRATGGVAVGELLVAHPGVDKVSFTGSTAAGRAVAAVCGPTSTKVSLELGGKSAAIILDDAAPEKVAAGVRSASLSNSGSDL